MSDRYSVEIEIGGNCPKARLKELAELLEHMGWYREWSDDTDKVSLMDELKLPEKGFAAFTQHDANISHQDELMDMLEDIKLPYVFRVHGSLVYDGSIIWWCPGFTSRWEMTADVNAQWVVVTQAWLLGRQKVGCTLSDVIEYLQQCPPKLPPFKIVDDPDHEIPAVVAG